MLVIDRKIYESFRLFIGGIDAAQITIIGRRPGAIRFGIKATSDLLILRNEVYDEHRLNFGPGPIAQKIMEAQPIVREYDGRLILSRKESEKLTILVPDDGDDIEIIVQVAQLRPGGARIGIMAPKCIRILREELCLLGDEKS